MPHSVLLFYYYDIIWWNLCVFLIRLYMFSCSEQLSPIHGFAQLYLIIFLNLVLVSALRDYLLKSFFSFRYCFIFFFHFMCLYAIWKFAYKKILKHFGHAECNVHSKQRAYDEQLGFIIGQFFFWICSFILSLCIK